MSTSTVERTGDWESVPFAGGFAGLRDLADDDFSGMVTTGPTRLFMTRGAVVGVLDGDVDDFADGGGTAREAPHPALPLLAVMQERSDEVRAKYYTEETPLSEVDRTLADGNFTGYVELSENVLSGDYYQVYHQGRSMSVAYVGASERLITDDEAFEQADDEVGIYEVRPVDVEIIDVPEPVDDTGGEAADDGDSGESDVEPGPDEADGMGVDDTADAGEVTEPDAGGTTGTAGTGSGPTPADDGAIENPEETAGASASADASTSSSSESAASEATTSEPGPSETTASESTSSGRTSQSDDDVTAETGTAAETSGDIETDESTTAASTLEPEQGASRSEPDTTASAGTDAPAGGRSTSTESATAEAATNDSTTSTATSEATGGQVAGRADNGGSTPGDQDAAGAQRQGQPAPDHPAVASREGEESTGERAAAPDADGAIGASDLEVHSLPSLDPSRTASASRQERERQASAGGGATTDPAQSPRPGSQGAPAQPGQGTDASDGADRSAQSRTPTEAGGTPTEQADAGDTRSGDGPSSTKTDGSEGATAGTAADTPDDGETGGADLAEARAEVERLEAELADLRGDHDAVIEERDRLEAELAEAREEIERLRARLDDATGSSAEANQKLSPREAIDETNLFVRYDSKGEATLEEAHAGEVDRDAVDANMRLEYHTSFDADDAAVDGVDFDTYLTDTVQYRFVDWLVRTLLYEIRDTGNTGPMAELYDALPKVDRAELNGQVGVQYTEDGQDHRAQIGFDVIVRDRMGNPLIVANLNDSRDPATDSMMTDLVRSAERVGESSSSLAGAFLVTRSFFEPGALETAEEATAGGLLNRGKQKSFVNLSRKGGYHLCLVEARNQEFHLAVPEL